MAISIQFQRTGPAGPVPVGRATLLDSGEITLSDMDDNLRKILEDGVIGAAKRGRMFPKDGKEFLRACMIQFSGTMLRAVKIEETT